MGWPTGADQAGWVATNGSRAMGPDRPARYGGPPAYPVMPRWGLPPLSWRVPTVVAGTAWRPPRTAEHLVRRARIAVPALWVLVISAVLATGGEVWRYRLLLQGRAAALPADLVTASDVLLTTCSVVCLIGMAIAVATTLWWLLTARERAAMASRRRPARPDWQVVLAVLVPGWNMVLAGCVLAELEHAVVGPASTARPRPSRLVWSWWAGWIATELLAVLTLLWGLRDGVQARADGVLWHAVTDLAAAVAATLTALVVRSFTAAIAELPAKDGRWWRVVRVVEAPEPPLRPGRAAGSAR